MQQLQHTLQLNGANLIYQISFHSPDQPNWSQHQNVQSYGIHLCCTCTKWSQKYLTNDIAPMQPLHGWLPLIRLTSRLGFWNTLNMNCWWKVLPFLVNIFIWGFVPCLSLYDSIYTCNNNSPWGLSLFMYMESCINVWSLPKLGCKVTKLEIHSKIKQLFGCSNESKLVGYCLVWPETIISLWAACGQEPCWNSLVQWTDVHFKVLYNLLDFKCRMTADVNVQYKLELWN